MGYSWWLYWFLRMSLDMTVRGEVVRYRPTRTYHRLLERLSFELDCKQWGTKNLVFYMGLDCSILDRWLKNDA